MTDRPTPEVFVACEACGGDWYKTHNGHRIVCEECDHGYVAAIDLDYVVVEALREAGYVVVHPDDHPRRHPGESG